MAFKVKGTDEYYDRIGRDLVRVSIEGIAYTTNTGVASVSSYTNPDGSGYELSLDSTIVVGQSGGTTWMNCILRGSVIGIRFLRQTVNPDMCVVIDGIPYEIPKYDLEQHFGNSNDTALSDWEAYYIIADDLDPSIPHSVSIYLPIDVSGTKNIRFYGFILERKAGYKEAAPNDMFYGNGILASADTYVAVPRTFATNVPVKSLKAISWTNISGAPVTVELRVTDDSYELKTVTLAAEEETLYQFGGNGVSPSNTLMHKASVANAVKFVCIGSPV